MNRLHAPVLVWECNWKAPVLPLVAHVASLEETGWYSVSIIVVLCIYISSVTHHLWSVEYLIIQCKDYTETFFVYLEVDRLRWVGADRAALRWLFSLPVSGQRELSREGNSMILVTNSTDVTSEQSSRTVSCRIFQCVVGIVKFTHNNQGQPPVRQANTIETNQTQRHQRCLSVSRSIKFRLVINERVHVDDVYLFLKKKKLVRLWVLDWLTNSFNDNNNDIAILSHLDGQKVITTFLL